MSIATPPPRVAIFGATSDIAAAVARQFAETGARLALVGRDRAGLAIIAADLRVRGAPEVVVQYADFAEIGTLGPAVEAAWQIFSGLDVVLIAYGTLPDQTRLQRDLAAARGALDVNFISPALLCDALALHFEAQKSGTIAVITSVAGDRGRKSNYLYGAAKGGLQRYVEGLRHRLFGAGVRVLDIRPGFVTTKMTSAVSRGGALWASPEKVGADIVAAIRKHKSMIYTPGFWRLIMLIVRNVPRAVLHRSSL